MNPSKARFFKARFLSACLGTVITGAGSVSAVEILDLGTLSGGSFSVAYDVSADGRVVVGASDSNNGEMGFRWTASGGMQNLGTIGTGPWGASAGQAVSANGLVVAGYATDFSVGPEGESRAFRWAAGSGMQSLGVLGDDAVSAANGISGDGSTLVGMSRGPAPSYGLTAIRWTASGGLQSLGYMPGGSFSYARAASWDGSVVVGEGDSANQGGAFRWTATQGMQPLGTLEPSGESMAMDVSADGAVVVGNASYEGSWYGFRWASDTGMVRVSTVLPGDTITTIFGVAPDGLVTAGSSYGTEGPGRAVVWDSAGGVHDLRDLLASSGSTRIGDWTNLQTAFAVSGDGLTYNVVGVGTIGGQDKGFLATGLTIRAVVNIGDVSAGEVEVPAGQQYDVGTASGGEINATAGSAQIGTLAGATLNTGSAGATVTTLSSGTINTSGGTVTTQGGTFTGTITGSGKLTMNGSGTLVLESANTYGGGTFITSGTVEIARGDAIGSAPVRIANNGKFRAVAGVAVMNEVIATSPAATYEHVLGESDPITNLAPITNGVAVADIAAGDSTATTVTSHFNANGSISLEGLDGTKFLMVLNLDGYIPEDATPATYSLGWWNEAANGGAGGWVSAIEGNYGANGSLFLAGGYTMGYQAFLSAYGPWDGEAMLGAYGLDVVNQQVWAVIDHNSDFGVTNNGILLVPEPGSLALAGLGLGMAGVGLRLRRRRGPA